MIEASQKPGRSSIACVVVLLCSRIISLDEPLVAQFEEGLRIPRVAAVSRLRQRRVVREVGNAKDRAHPEEKNDPHGRAGKDRSQTVFAGNGPLARQKEQPDPAGKREVQVPLAGHRAAQTRKERGGEKWQ